MASPRGRLHALGYDGLPGGVKSYPYRTLAARLPVFGHMIYLFIQRQSARIVPTLERVQQCKVLCLTKRNHLYNLLFEFCAGKKPWGLEAPGLKNPAIF